MPAYNYFPATYQPYQPVYYQQPQQQSSLIWFSGNEKDAYDYPVAPNNAVTLWSTVAPVVYKKVADASGKPTLTIYDLVERSQNAPTGVERKEGKDIGYALKSDMEALGREFEAIKAEVEALKRKKGIEDDVE